MAENNSKTSVAKQSVRLFITEKKVMSNSMRYIVDNIMSLVSKIYTQQIIFTINVNDKISLHSMSFFKKRKYLLTVVNEATVIRGVCVWARTN